MDLHKVGVSLLVLLLFLIAVTVTLFFVASLCKALRYCETPFSEDIVQRIRRVAWSLIPWALLGGGNFQSPFEMLTDGSIDVFVGINLETVLLILIIFALSFIFRYGAMLQQESDETL